MAGFFWGPPRTPKGVVSGQGLRPQSEEWPAPVRVLISTHSVPLEPQSLVCV